MLIAFTCSYIALLISCGFYQFPKPGDKFVGQGFYYENDVYVLGCPWSLRI